MAKQPPHEAAGVEMHTPLTDQIMALQIFILTGLEYVGRCSVGIVVRRWFVWSFHSCSHLTHLYSVVMAFTRQCPDELAVQEMIL
jgi:hypothetical protein